MQWLKDTIDKIGTSDIIALTLTGVSSFLWIRNGDIPESLLVLTTTIVGFFFANKQQQQQFAAANPAPGAPYIEDNR